MLNNTDNNNSEEISETNNQNNNENNNENEDHNEEIKNTFTLFDQDNDNKITKQELSILLRALGKNITDNEINSLIVESNLVDELINFDSFITILNKITPKDTEAELLEAYELFDTENNGYINISEFRHIMTNLGEKLSIDEIDNIIKELDPTNQGKIMKDNFINVLL
tara:strand:- start:201 stop:704 length:504 start_codon:yes stop_codon:yes gene_type:complete